MPRSDYRTLINMGRKAGLQTSELYSALAGRQPQSNEIEARDGDGNGFAAGVDDSGRHVYLPKHSRQG